MTILDVAAKINLALLVGRPRDDGLHEVATVLQRIEICDRLELTPAPALVVEGYGGDTLVRAALVRLAEAVGVEPRWHARLVKRIPVGAGLAGGSADAAGALLLANASLGAPLGRDRLHELAAAIGSDVPFFLEPGPKLAEGAGETLTPLELPQDFAVLLVVPEGARKASTGDVYRRFDEGDGRGFEERRRVLVEALASCRRPRDFAAFPPNDLAQAAGPQPLLETLRAAGAFRADVSGAGPALYALFDDRAAAAAAAGLVEREAGAWVVAPVW
ncbi:MAG: 4-(cytidine 5'-diphospho)-2-C-methyl-D-erythritol kinase [Actinomycetota bacterium]|nr:4-(cytidine 5'-diphospho)-2-C-methyl-D-erythritol kinase [Actinomycetota bacterium]